MSWKNILKEDEASIGSDEQERRKEYTLQDGQRPLSFHPHQDLTGKEGTLDDIMKMINDKFGVKSKILYDTSPLGTSGEAGIGFELPVFVICKKGTKDPREGTGKFTVRHVAINTSEIR
jgi:hypothetical protein